MSVLSTRCWSHDDARAILRTEALSGEDEVFLATHTPVESFDVGGSHASDVAHATERGLLEALAKPGLQHAWCVIQGEPGSGKSHVIRWLDVNWPHESDQKLLIQRANGSLDGTLRQLQRSLPAKFQSLFENLKQHQAAGLGGRSMQFLTSLGVSLHPEYFDTPPDDAEWCRKYEPEKLILNTKIRDNWTGPRRVLEIMNGGDARNSASANFTLEDVMGLIDYCSEVRDSERSATLARRLMSEFVHVREQLEEGRSWDEIATQTLNIPESLQLVRSLNTRRNHAVQNVIGVSADGLKRLFEELRAALKLEGRRLVLLLEDVTSWQGVDDSLIDVLTTDATTRPEKDLCPLISVVGVTPDYYEQDLRGNYQQRITLNIRLGKGDGRFEEIGTLNNSEKRAGFVSKYLSAARTGEAGLKTWREQLRTDPDLPPPNACIRCPRSEQCHAIFGQIDGIGLFPFTRTSVDGFFSALKSDSRGQTYRTPRGMLQGVLAPTLLHTQVFDEDLYPGPQIEPAFIQRVSLSPLLESQLRDRVSDDTQRARLRRLFAYWGDNRPVLTPTDDGDLRYAGVRKSLIEAFDLPWIADDARLEDWRPDIVDPEPEPTEGPAQAPSPLGEPRPEGVERKTATRPLADPRAQSTGPRPQARKELEQRLAEIEKLEGEEALPNPAKWHALVHEVMQTIDFRRLDVDRWTFDKVFTPETLKIAGAGKIDQRHMEIPRAEWLIQGLKAYASLRTEGADLTHGEIEHARRHLASLVSGLERLARSHLARRMPNLASGQPWRPMAAVVQVLLARAWLRGEASPTASLAVQWRAVLSDEAETETAPTLRTTAWQDILNATGRRHADLRAMLHDMVSLPQGGARNFGLADLSMAVQAMLDLARTQTLGALPVEGDGKPPVGDLQALRDVAAKINSALPSVISRESDLLANRSDALRPLLRGKSIRAHVDRVDHVVKTVSDALPMAASVQVREWIDLAMRQRRLLDDRAGLGRVQALLSEAGEQLEPGQEMERLAWLIEAPASDLKALLELAQRGEATLDALSPHVADLVAGAGASEGLSGLHERGAVLLDAAGSAAKRLEEAAA